MSGYQLLPELSAEDYARLRADIEQRGVLVPVEVDENGTVLDGHHRQRIATELGIDCPTVTRAGMAECDKFIHAGIMNLARRHMTDKQKVEAGEKLEPHYAERARQRMLAGKATDPEDKCPQGAGAGEKKRAPQVRDEVAEAVGLESGRTFERGKKTLAEARELAPTTPEVAEVLADTDAPLRAVSAAVKKAKRVAAESKPIEVPRDRDPLNGDGWEIRIGDFRDQLADLEPGTVDLIVTDPPYPKDDLPLYGDLGELAAKLLKPRGLLFCWTGQIFLPDVINYLGWNLTYGWTFALDMPGGNSRIMGRHLIQTWKPVLAYSTGTWPSGEWGDDRLISPERTKTTFEWEQNAAPATRIIERFSAPNALVVDPFTGTGAFGLAAVAAGRRFLGVELDQERAATAQQRLRA